jgi:ceramide glucosyltransferase
VFGLAQILQFICLVPILGGAIFSILTVFTIQHFLKNSKPNFICNFTPPLTVLKPVRGLEKNLKHNLRTIATQDYPNYQIIYSVQDPEDPAFSILKEIQEEFGSNRISLVVSPLEAGANGKVNNLLGAIKKAHHDIIIISDSDTNLQPDYLKKIVAPLDNPEVGCVCTLFKVIRGHHWFEKMELLTINADFIPSVIFATVTGASNVCLGPSIAIRQSTLETIGGLESLADYLVEDYEIGRRVCNAGKNMVLLPYMIDVVVDLKNLRAWWDHQVYWDQNTYLAKPLPFIATILIRSIPFALLLALIRRDIIGLYNLIGTVTIRLITAGITSWKMEDTEGMKNLYLLPFRDILGLVFWALSFTQRIVIWRGVEFKLTGHGKMVVRH